MEAYKPRHGEARGRVPGVGIVRSGKCGESAGPVGFLFDASTKDVKNVCIVVRSSIRYCRLSGRVVQTFAGAEDMLVAEVGRPGSQSFQC